MRSTRMFRRASPLVLGLALVSAACAQQPSGGPSQPSSGTSGMDMQGHDMSGTGGMQGHDMSGMDTQTMMTHCAQMRQQVRQGVDLSPDMRGMMAQCDQMDRQTGTVSGGAAPATRTR